MTFTNKPVRFLSEVTTFRIYLLFFICILSILFFIGGPDYYSSRSYKELWNLGHIVYFAALPLIIYSFSPIEKYKPVVQIAILLILTVGLGVLIELFQYGFNRSPDLTDIYRNTLGWLVAVVFIIPTKKSIRCTGFLAVKAMVLLLVAAQLIPVGLALIDERQARCAFPVLSDFQTVFQLNRWRGSAERTIVKIPETRKNSAMQVTFSTAKYSGVSLKYFPGKWDGYNNLELRAFNPSAKSFRITCRIHDARHNQQYKDRFNHSFEVHSGWNLITINLDNVRQAPDKREMDLDQIRSIGIFTVQLPESREMIIDDLRLY